MFSAKQMHMITTKTSLSREMSLRHLFRCAGELAETRNLFLLEASVLFDQQLHVHPDIEDCKASQGDLQMETSTIKLFQVA